MIKTVIIDDERLSRDLLRKMLVDFCKDVTIVGEAIGVSSGIELLQEVQPDIILLDIEMSDGNGFDILNAFDFIRSHVIFVTGYDRYAIKAIKHAALDYLLKPVNLEELQLAIQKLGKSTTDENGQLRLLQSQYENRNGQLQQIVIPGHDNYSVIEVQQIIRIEAKGSYVIIYMEDQKSHTVVNTLSYYEKLLPQNNFFRIHKSHLINIHKIKNFATGRGGKIRLKDGSELDIAARRKSDFNQFIKQLGK